MMLLAACGSNPVAKNKIVATQAADQIECAIGETADFSRDCAIERGEGSMLTLRHNDGGFRRLTLEADGTIDTADGAEGMTVQPLSDGRTEVVIGADRYRLPATL